MHFSWGSIPRKHCRLPLKWFRTPILTFQWKCLHIVIHVGQGKTIFRIWKNDAVSPILNFKTFVSTPEIVNTLQSNTVSINCVDGTLQFAPRYRFPFRVHIPLISSPHYPFHGLALLFCKITKKMRFQKSNDFVLPSSLSSIRWSVRSVRYLQCRS